MPSDNFRIKLLKTGIIVCLLPLFGLILFSCKECPAEPETDKRITTINLKLVRTWTTSLTFRVSVIDTSASWTFGLVRDDSIVFKQSVSGKDTIVTDRGLIPSTQYRYHACWMKKGIAKDSSEEVIATTMDTTSHNFSWEVDVFGEYGSYLKGVTIINNENIWVVGALVIDDSTSRYRGQINYNLAKWNGETWSYELVGAAGVTCYDIHYFSENDIWIAAKLIYHWDGNEWVRYHLWYMDILDEDDGGVEYIWASSPANIFFVGRKGTIVHYNGSTFTKMESGTDSPIIDIWGIDENHIWATSCTNVLDDDHPDGYESVTYFFNGYEWIRKYVAAPEHHSDYSKTEIAGYMNSVWAYEDTVYISSHSGLWKESITTGKGRLDHGPDKRLDGYPFWVRGTAYNDVYAFTQWAEFLHFNGKGWSQDLSLDYFYVDDVAVKDDMVVMVGDLKFTCAVIVRGYHLP